ncbi:MAG: hypothetical protein ISEC1_P1158 [Thiomicrorhabdus sp.]|nr:MAG: hypothetical protein ISEC1_P1158 [Thiomicrorhabdus sp.]
MACYIQSYLIHPLTMKKITTLLSALLISSYASAGLTATIPDFQSTYDVNAFGANLGQARNSFKCIGENCTLISSAKPSGFAALFIKDSSVETIKLKQTDQSIEWQSYHKLGISENNGKRVQKHTNLRLDEKSQQIQAPEKERSWPAQPNLFDVMSISYALQYYKLNNQSIKKLDLHIQDSNFQEKLKILTADQSDNIDLAFSPFEVKALKYSLDSQNYQIDLWLLPNKQFFPAKIRVINKHEDKTITLKLAEQPKIL